MSNRYRIDGEWTGYMVTGRPRADGRVLFQLFGQERKVWRKHSEVEQLV